MKKEAAKKKKSKSSQCWATRHDQTTPARKDAFKNIEWVGRGYNIYYGDPSAKYDQGPGNYLFTFDWTKLRGHSMGVYPQGTSVYLKSRCNSDIVTTVQTSVKDLRKASKRDISLTVGYDSLFYSVSATASTSYQTK